MQTESIETLVIGAGVVGLAVARALAQAGREVLVVEAAEAVGTGISARNSEVIHAGLYYPQGSLKARLCVEGQQRLYRFCHTHHVPHKRLGKLVVATDPAQIPRLRQLAAQAEANGVAHLELCEGAALRQREPELRAELALWSPDSGIIDVHALLLALQHDLESAGGMLALHAPVVSGSVEAQGRICVEVGGEAPMRLAPRQLINAAGLSAQAVANAITGPHQARIPPAHLAKGHYFGLSGQVPFRHLIYPLPEPGGLGVHLTLDLAGQARFGPDVEWVEHADYGVDTGRRDAFVAAIARYWPGVVPERLTPAYAGIRPKLVGPDGGAQDFLIQGPAAHGVEGMVHLYGIESPGLTASLAIAELVARTLEGG